jgi:hypothetical protein
MFARGVFLRQENQGFRVKPDIIRTVTVFASQFCRQELV